MLHTVSSYILPFKTLHTIPTSPFQDDTLMMIINIIKPAGSFFLRRGMYIHYISVEVPRYTR